MITEKTLKELLSHGKCHDLSSGISKETIKAFEQNNSIALPEDLKQLYEHFDGGEIFVPGTTIYGLTPSQNRMNLREANSKKKRENFSLPNMYLIFARLNYGDTISVNLNAPFDVVQWDHENDEEYCTWNSVDDWLNEAICTFESFKEGDD